MRVAVADERGEISATCHGVPGVDIGFADVITGVEKSAAVMMAVRTLNPRLVAFDELGSVDDANAVVSAAASGVGVVATLHATTIAQVQANPLFCAVASHIRTVVLLGGCPGDEITIYKPKEQNYAVDGGVDDISGTGDVGRGVFAEICRKGA